jgi:hypothetical protein
VAALRGVVVRALPVAVAGLAWPRLRPRLPADRAWYAATGGADGRSTGALWWDYLLRGRRAGRSPHPLLQPAWVAPTSWRDPRREPLLRVLAGASPHPLLAGGPSGDPRAWAGEHADLSAAALAAVRSWALGERLRRLPRATATPPSGVTGAGRGGALAPPRPPARSGARAMVSVVMAVRDRPVQVLDAIASVRAQTFTDWELVVVDDGSSDSTPDVVAQVASRDARVRLVRGARAGVSAARNTGQQHATGSVLAWLDSDNTWLPDHLAALLGALGDAEVEAVYTALECRTEDGVRYRALDAGLDALRVLNHVDLNVLAVRAEVLAQVGGFDESLRRAVDYDLVLRLAQRRPLRFVPRVTACYDERREAGDRVTVQQPAAWSDVVRQRRVLDEAALTRPREAGRTGLVLLAGPVGLDVLADLVRAALADTPDAVAVMACGQGPAVAGVLGAWSVADPAVTYRFWPAPVTTALALGLALEQVRTEQVVVRAPGTEPLSAATAALALVRGGDALLAPGPWRADLLDRLG